MSNRPVNLGAPASIAERGNIINLKKMIDELKIQTDAAMAAIAILEGATGGISGSGTIGRIPYFTAPGAIGDSNIYYDVVNGWVGFGLIPTSKFPIKTIVAEEISTGGVAYPPTFSLVDNLGNTSFAIRNSLGSKENIYIGKTAGQKSTTALHNVIIGSLNSGERITDGSQNLIVGASSGTLLTTGGQNVLLGYGAGLNLVGGWQNMIMGYATGYYCTGDGNVLIGAMAGLAGGHVDYNTFIGQAAGYSSAGSNGIALGNMAGYYETAGKKLIIDSLDRSTEARGRSEALIYGVIDATPANQILNLGGGGLVGIAGSFKFSGGTPGAGKVLTSDAVGLTSWGSPASAAWPIGSIFISVVDTDPATLLGIGTWARIASGRFLVSQDSANAKFDVVRETGGAQTHLHSVDPPITTTSQPSLINELAGTGAAIIPREDHTHTVDIAAFDSAAGSSLPPYFVVYMWERTA